MSDPAREETLAALAILRERLLQAVAALDAAQVALAAEDAGDQAVGGEARETEAEDAAAAAPSDAADEPLAAPPSIADLTRRFEAIREQLAAVGVRAAAPSDAPPPPPR